VLWVVSLMAYPGASLLARVFPATAGLYQGFPVRICHHTGTVGQLKGRPTRLRSSAVPSGLGRLGTAVPNVETLGCYQESLRDEDEILVALDVPPNVETLSYSRGSLRDKDPAQSTTHSPRRRR
jgi:hypothetical protein